MPCSMASDRCIGSSSACPRERSASCGASACAAEVVFFFFSGRLVARFAPIILILDRLSPRRCALDGHGIRSRLCGCSCRSRRCMPRPSRSRHFGTLHFLMQNVPDALRNSAQGLYTACSAGLFLMLATAAVGPDIRCLRRACLSRHGGHVGCGFRAGFYRAAYQPQSARGGGCIRLPAKLIPGTRSSLSSSGPSRSTNCAYCASSMAGAMASDVASMQPTMISRSLARAARRQSKGFGQAAGLVELDVDRVIFADQLQRCRRHRGPIHRRRSATLRSMRPERLIVRRQARAARPVRRRSLGAGREHARQVRFVPAFIGIDDEPRLGGGRADGRDALLIALAAELELEERPVGTRRRPPRPWPRGVSRLSV